MYGCPRRETSDFHPTIHTIAPYHKLSNMHLNFRYRGFSSGRGIRKFHVLNASGGPRSSLRLGLNLFQSPELKMILKFLKSPGHLIFVASNVAILAHLQFYSTVRRKQRTEEFMRQMQELENYVELINDLDAQNDEIQRQIASLKRLQKKEDVKVSPAVEKKPTARPNFLPLKSDLPLSKQVRHAQMFLKQRQMYASTFSNPENIAKLFPENLTNVDLEKLEQQPFELTYYSRMQNSLMALSSQLIKSFLIELNLRHSFQDNGLNEAITPDSFLLHDDLFALMKDDEEKRELMTKLLAFREPKQRGGEQPFLNNLDSDAIEKMLDDFKHSMHFKSKELRRHDFYEYKSGHWLNYEESDTLKSIQAALPPRFHSNTVSSNEYIRNFEKIFASYENSSGTLKHMNLALELAQALAFGGEKIPSYSVLRYLLDNLGKLGLYNYQSLVYDVLPKFEHRQTALADSPQNQDFAPRKSFHFSHLIEDDPDFLGSLIMYQVPRKDMTTFNQLMAFFNVFERSDNLSSSILPPFMKPHGVGQATPADLNKPQLVSVDTISKAFSACVELKQYPLLDTLINKLVYDLVQTSEGLKIAIGSAGREVSPTTKSSEIFTENILTLLAKAYIETKDSARAKWLLPHVGSFIKANPSADLSNYETELQSTLVKRKLGKKSTTPFRQGIEIDRKAQKDVMRTAGKTYKSEPVSSTVSAMA